MKQIAVVAAIFVAGCNPIPAKQMCRMPDFSASTQLKVKDSFSTWGYFSERCPKATPKQFLVPGQAASLEVLIQGEWFRLSAKDNSGTSLQLKGKALRQGGNARIDEQDNNVLEVEAVPRNGGQPERFTLPFGQQECTCVTYDAV